MGRLEEVVSRLAMGVVTLEDHPIFRHVTGSPPLQLLQWLCELVGVRARQSSG